MSFIQYTTTIARLPHLAMHYLEVPPHIVRQLGGKFNTRLLCTIHQTTFHCGLMALRDGSAYISISARRMKEAGVQPGTQVEVLLEKDTSTYGMEMPEELAEVLQQDEEGDRRFHALTPGKQRNIIHYVASVKNPQLRVDRAIGLIENLKRLPQGKETVRAIFGGV